MDASSCADGKAVTDLVELLRNLGYSEDSRLVELASGTFYTPFEIAQHLIDVVLDEIGAVEKGGEVSICDPFAGDGRLVAWLIEEAARRGIYPNWNVHLWDLNENGLSVVMKSLARLRGAGLDIDCETWTGDSLMRLSDRLPRFDIVLTNPPWENLKPDNRELRHLPDNVRGEYVAAIKARSLELERLYPESRALKKYGGWGTNLSRVGLQASLTSLRASGLLGIVLPLSILADDASKEVRRELMRTCRLLDVACFPAELRAFKGVDVGACTLLVRREIAETISPRVTVYGKGFQRTESDRVTLELSLVDSEACVLPLASGPAMAKLLTEFERLPTFGSLESNQQDGLWAGRELDETRISESLTSRGAGPYFIKGRMIQRFSITDQPILTVRRDGWIPPVSTNFKRVVWRDVSRRSQRRRMIATIIPPGVVAGNSLGVTYFRDGNDSRLHVLLGLMSSLCFEVQLRATLATGHVTLSTLRRMHLPDPTVDSPLVTLLIQAVEDQLKGTPGSEVRVEAIAAKLFGLNEEALTRLLECFSGLPVEESAAIRATFCGLQDMGYQ